MADVIRIFVELVWLALAIYGIVSVRKWNRSFAELHEKLSESLEESDNA